MTIRQTFDQLRQAGRIALMPFVPAGYPSLEATAAMLPAMADAGADLIEIGIPFSDPIADGPVIQAAFNHALSVGRVKVADVLATVKSVSARVRAPMVAMVSYSIVYRYGLDRFIADAKAAGFSGLILPDLPPPEAQAVCGKVNAAGLETVLLVAPTTSPQRKAEIARLSTGFVYYLSVAGTTGARSTLPADLPDNLAALRALTDRPLCVGFGVSTRDHVAQLAQHADGAIFGSALVKQLTPQQTPAQAAKAASEFVASLR